MYSILVFHSIREMQQGYITILKFYIEDLFYMRVIPYPKATYKHFERKFIYTSFKCGYIIDMTDRFLDTSAYLLS